MDNKLTVFSNPEFGNVRSLTIDNEPWFVGKDVAVALGYAKPENAISSHVYDDDKTTTLIQGTGSNYKSKSVIINESGLYSLIFGSKLEKAKEFKHWVTSEVLPTIRKTGGYTAKPSEPKEDKRGEAMLKNAQARLAKIWLEIANNTGIKEYKDVCNAYAAKELAGKDVLPLPEVAEKTYSATEIGVMLGVSKTKIGTLANQHGMKTAEYGKLFYDKSPYSAKEVETFRYYECAIEKFKELLEGGESA